MKNGQTGLAAGRDPGSAISSRLIQPRGPSRALNAAATTRVGSTNEIPVSRQDQALAPELVAGKQIGAWQAKQQASAAWRALPARW